MQDGKPVALFSRMLTEAQRSYTVIEKELLSAVEVLREYRRFLTGSATLIHQRIYKRRPTLSIHAWHQQHTHQGQQYIGLWKLLQDLLFTPEI